MRNKKILTPLFLAASFLLAGCSSDTIVARPDWIDGDIIDVSGLKDNKLKSIYDAVKKLGDTNSAVLTRVMYDIAKTHIGEYKKLKEYFKLGEEEAIKSQDFKDFVASHPIYKANTMGAKLNATTGEVVEVDFSKDPTKMLRISFNKIKDRYEQIKEDIAEKLYNEIKGGTYSDSYSKLFQEEKFVNHLKKELYSVDTTTTFNNNIFIKPLQFKEKYAEIIGQYLDITNETRYSDYINRKVLPDLYKTYLTETYVYQQRYSSLGRSYARKVEMISVPYGSYRSNVVSMLQYFSKTYITGNDGKQTIVENNYNFKHISDAMVGFSTIPTSDPTESFEAKDIVYKLLNYTNDNTPVDPLDPDAWKSRRNFPRIQHDKVDFIYHTRTNENGIARTRTDLYADASRTYVYSGTKLGDVIEKLLKFTDVKITTTQEGKKEETFVLKANRSEAAEKAYNEFTNNQAQSIEESIVLREREARANTFTKEGWFLKNGGLTDLDDTFRNNLFNISAAAVVDNYDKVSNPDAKYEAGEFVQYFGSVNGKDYTNRKAFLTTSKSSLYETVVLAGKSNAFIVEVKEAINSSKLSAYDNSRSYIRAKAKLIDPNLDPYGIASTKITDTLVKEIVKVNSSSDTYKNNANQYYLMISNIIFYDQSVYDYFKSQFPDLFK